jgi:phosphoribosylformimino-5-aminoimidazole carboxamide ribotide isomerase
MIKIIPAIDIIDGKCVRLKQGDYEQKKVYDEDPVAVAKRFAEAGIERLHMVDLDGAKAGHVINDHILKRVVEETNLIVDFGGGIKSNDDIQKVFDAGANQASIGTIAVKNPKLLLSWLQKYGAERIILGADVLDGIVRINGWANPTEIKLFDFLTNYRWHGFQYVLCTDISKDGMMQGSSIELYESIMKQFPEVKLIASGGVSSLEEIRQLEKIGCYGVVLGKAIYENQINIKDLVATATK